MQSKQLFEKAKRLIPGGVNSPVRAFKGVGGDPIFFKAGKGAYLYDVDDKSYIDYVGSWGPLILGHCHPSVVEAVIQALSHGMSFGAPTELEVQLAEKIIQLMPNIEKIRMVNSGTEATLTAVRLARGFTNRNKIIKLNGCYHGHHDSLLVKAGSGVLTLGLPSTAGIPAGITEHTLTADFNDIEGITSLFEQFGGDIAAIILEPIAGNMGFVCPRDGFLAQLRSLCDRFGSLLIFDEVMTGFRVALGGAQAYYDIVPDLTTLGKVIGGGMPVGAVGGKAAIMDTLAPVGPVYQAGTLSGNPLAMAAGLATLKEVEKPHFHEQLETHALQLVAALKNAASTYDIPLWGKAIGGMFGFCFSEKNVIASIEDIKQSDEDRFRQFYHGMLQEGIYFAPSLYEAGFISSAHGADEIAHTEAAAHRVMKALSVSACA